MKTYTVHISDIEIGWSLNLRGRERLLNQHAIYYGWSAEKLAGQLEILRDRAEKEERTA
jgi:hypothetical protein